MLLVASPVLSRTELAGLVGRDGGRALDGGFGREPLRLGVGLLRRSGARGVTAGRSKWNIGSY